MEKKEKTVHPIKSVANAIQILTIHDMNFMQDTYLLHYEEHWAHQ